MQINKIKFSEIPIFYINLDKDLYRKKRIEYYLDKIGHKNYERFPGINTEKRIGVSLSHSKILKYIIKENIYPCIILEDDAIPLYTQEYLEFPTDSDAFYLGITNSGSDFTSKNNNISHEIFIKNKTKNFHQVVNMTGRHAIMHLSKEYDKESIDYNFFFIKNYKRIMSGDVAISMLNSKRKVFAQNFPFFYQDSALEEYFTKLNIEQCNYKIL